jgi:hypothetical protein
MKRGTCGGTSPGEHRNSFRTPSEVLRNTFGTPTEQYRRNTWVAGWRQAGSAAAQTPRMNTRANLGREDHLRVSAHPSPLSANARQGIRQSCGIASNAYLRHC